MSLKTYDDGKRLRYMDLRSVLPTGEEILTRWIPGARFTEPNQVEQADYHREKVRTALRGEWRVQNGERP